MPPSPILFAVYFDLDSKRLSVAQSGVMLSPPGLWIVARISPKTETGRS